MIVNLSPFSGKMGKCISIFGDEMCPLQFDEWAKGTPATTQTLVQVHGAVREREGVAG